jgi:hypothetical protein
MGDYVIKMNLEVYDKKNPKDNIGVVYDTDMSEEEAESIDAVEKKFINLNRQVLKEGISEHLANISKKKCQKYQEQNGGIIEKNGKPYKVDGEVGRFTFETHSVYADDKNVLNTAKDVFKTLYSKEWYRTMGFNELALDFSSHMSYRQSSQKINRIRNESEGTPVRTLSNIVEMEGAKVQEEVTKMTKNILYDNNFSENGTPNEEAKAKTYTPNKRKICMNPKIVEAKIKEYNKDKPDNLKVSINQQENFYENTENTINASLDDVCVKKQKEKRPKDTEKSQDLKKHYVRNTIVHLEKQKEKYCLNAASTGEVLPRIVAFLLFNNSLKNYLLFFVDGEQSLHKAIVNGFSWFKSYGILLDWYHLGEKCKMELSLALKKREFRNEILEKVEQQLWIGKIDSAIKILEDIDKDNIKCENNIQRLIGYFERNRNYIPCYAIRKSLGLRISSNKAEKSNDLLVANRQKHNGMSWSKDGSVALTTITTLYKNNEQNEWYEKSQIKFKFVS